MTLKYHGTPITPVSVLKQLKGRNFCVSFAAPRDVKRCHIIGQSVMLDNGAFSAWKIGKPTDWPGFYAWCDRWLDYPTTWAVIPDVIDAGPDAQDELLAQWPFGERGAPVWHMDEPLDRFLKLVDAWPKTCIGSTAAYKDVLSPLWRVRMDEVFDAVAKRHRRMPWIHMLRGMSCAEEWYPFASLDSTDVARNHSRGGRTPCERADRWDAVQCPAHKFYGEVP